MFRDADTDEADLQNVIFLVFGKFYEYSIGRFHVKFADRQINVR